MEPAGPRAVTRGGTHGDTIRTTCAIVGGGPAGLFLGLLLARAGRGVTVLEKHADFLRDFRGDTVHPSTMTLLDELGLWPEFAAAAVEAHRAAHRWSWTRERRRSRICRGCANRTRSSRWCRSGTCWTCSPGPRPPSRRSRLLRRARVDGSADGRRPGDRGAVDRCGRDGAHELRADLVVACDGRDSVLRNGFRATAAGLPGADGRLVVPAAPRATKRIPAGALARVSGGRMVILLDRGDYYQVAYLLPARRRRRPSAGADHRAAGVAACRCTRGSATGCTASAPGTTSNSCRSR